MTQIQVRHPDNPDPYVYETAPSQIASQIQRRFDARPVVIHPDEENVFIYDPGNFWDGATHVTYEPETGHFTFDGWGGPGHFPAIGPV